MEEMSKSEFLNEDGHGKMRESDADAYSWWRNDRLKQCVEEIVHAVRKLKAECPDGGVMDENEEVILEDKVRDFVVEALESEFDLTGTRLHESGFDDGKWESRLTCIERQRRLGGAI